MKATLSPLLLLAGATAFVLSACEPREPATESPVYGEYDQQEETAPPPEQQQQQQDDQFGQQQEIEPQRGQEQEQEMQAGQDDPGAQPGAQEERQGLMTNINRAETQLGALRQAAPQAPKEQIEQMVSDLESAVEDLRSEVDQMD